MCKRSRYADEQMTRYTRGASSKRWCVRDFATWRTTSEAKFCGPVGWRGLIQSTVMHEAAATGRSSRPHEEPPSSVWSRSACNASKDRLLRAIRRGVMLPKEIADGQEPTALLGERDPRLPDHVGITVT